MRLIFLSDGWTVVLCFVSWGFLQITAALICLKSPTILFDRLLVSIVFIVLNRAERSMPEYSSAALEAFAAGCGATFEEEGIQETLFREFLKEISIVSS